MTLPLVSVVIPVFNAAPYVGATIESVLGQTHPRIETLVIDDGSTDATPAVLARYASRVRVTRQPNAGAGAARNLGIAQARGEYVVLLDHDDLLEPDAITRQLEVASRHPLAALVVCDGIVFDGNGTISSSLFYGRIRRLVEAAPTGEHEGPWYEDVLRFSPISCPAQVLLSRRALERAGPFVGTRDETSDYEAYVRIARTEPIVFHRARLVRYRYLPGGRSGDEARRRIGWTRMTLSALRRELIEGPRDARGLVRRELRRHARRAPAIWQAARHRHPVAARALIADLVRASPFIVIGWAGWLLTALPRWAPEPVFRVIEARSSARRATRRAAARVASLELR